MDMWVLFNNKWVIIFVIDSVEGFFFVNNIDFVVWVVEKVVVFGVCGSGWWWRLIIVVVGVFESGE